VEEAGEEEEKEEEELPEEEEGKEEEEDEEEQEAEEEVEAAEDGRGRCASSCAPSGRAAPRPRTWSKATRAPSSSRYRTRREGLCRRYSRMWRRCTPQG
jgi:hypothetical protein